MKLNNGDTYVPLDTDIIAWQKAYPAIDVNQELAAMESWLDANPSRRKTKRGIKRFINSWLMRAQDKGGSPMAKKQDNLRSRTIEDSLADVSWIQDAQAKNRAKHFFLNKYGFYYDTEGRKNV